MKHARDLLDRIPTSAASPPAVNDPRWRIVNLVVGLREELSLTGSDIAVLRAMVFLIPRETWGQQMMVHASNRLLAERSDAMNERTLRRAIQRLCAAGLIARRDSSNRKRYRVSLGVNEAPICFGFDLNALLHLSTEFEERAALKAAELSEMRGLKSLIRHQLYQLETETTALSDEELASYRLQLRRRLTLSDLRELQAELGLILEPTDKTPVTDSQNVRHIQSSSPEYKKEDLPQLSFTAKPAKQSQVGVNDCIEATPSAMEFAVQKPETWQDLHRLAESLSSGLGIEAQPLAIARQSLGPIGFTLAILGLIEAMGRVASPAAYLTKLCRESQANCLDLGRMFRSLTRKRPSLACLPG